MDIKTAKDIERFFGDPDNGDDDKFAIIWSLKDSLPWNIGENASKTIAIDFLKKAIKEGLSTRELFASKNDPQRHMPFEEFDVRIEKDTGQAEWRRKERERLKNCPEQKKLKEMLEFSASIEKRMMEECPEELAKIQRETLGCELQPGGLYNGD